LGLAPRLPDSSHLVGAQDPGTGAKTLLYHIEVDRGIPWASAQGMLGSSSATAQVRAQA
jgi:hypothetical protein